MCIRNNELIQQQSLETWSVGLVSENHLYKNHIILVLVFGSVFFLESFFKLGVESLTDGEKTEDRKKTV